MKETIQFKGETLEVIARQPAMLPHPNPIHDGKLVKFRSVNELLLANDERAYECVFPNVECNFVADNGQSVVAHQSTHNPASHGSDYDPDVLRKLLRTAKVEIRDRGHRGYAERTAKLLNDGGFTQLGGQPFNASQVSQLFRRWVEEIPVRVPTGAELARKKGRENVKTNDASEVKVFRAEHNPAEAKIAEALAISEDTKRVAVTNAEKIEKLLKEAFVDAGRVAEVDPVVADKARRWDDMQKLLNGGS